MQQLHLIGLAGRDCFRAKPRIITQLTIHIVQCFFKRRYAIQNGGILFFRYFGVLIYGELQHGSLFEL